MQIVRIRAKSCRAYFIVFQLIARKKNTSARKYKSFFFFYIWVLLPLKYIKKRIYIYIYPTLRQINPNNRVCGARPPFSPLYTSCAPVPAFFCELAYRCTKIVIYKGGRGAGEKEKRAPERTDG